MELRISLTNESESRLRNFAAAAGKDVYEVVAEAIEEKLAAGDIPAADDHPLPRSAEEWIAELREWAASHPRIDHFVDDSRESIYVGRGE